MHCCCYSFQSNQFSHYTFKQILLHERIKKEHILMNILSTVQKSMELFFSRLFFLLSTLVMVSSHPKNKNLSYDIDQSERSASSKLLFIRHQGWRNILEGKRYPPTSTNTPHSRLASGAVINRGERVCQPNSLSTQANFSLLSSLL